MIKGDEAAGGGFCKVLGGIDPVDANAPDINFQINLPLEWNNKSIQYGGGGYDGILIEAVKNVSFGSDEVKTPLQRGYVTYGSDGGHQANPLDGRFLMNDEALANYGGAAVKKVHDVAMAVIQANYEKAPEKSYIQGNSQGGHETLIGIQRWPDDYDGAIVTHPANPFVMLQLAGNHYAKTYYGTNAYINPAETAFLDASVTAACDKLDGAEDGLISNTAACDATFKIEDLRCESGDNEGDTCFSDAQIAFLKLMNTPVEVPFEMENGVTSFGQWPVFHGGDTYGLWGFGMAPTAMFPPAPVANFVLYVFSDPMVRFATMRDPSYNSLDFKPEKHVERLQELSKIMDSNATDLSPFTDKGGKILLMHGTIDFAISPTNTIMYYNRIVDTMGKDTVDSFMKFLMVPGFGHGTGKFLARWDPLTALENWAEKGEAPKDLIVTDGAKDTAGRSQFPLRRIRARLYPAPNPRRVFYSTTTGESRSFTKGWPTRKSRNARTFNDLFPPGGISA